MKLNLDICKNCQFKSNDKLVITVDYKDNKCFFTVDVFGCYTYQKEHSFFDLFDNKVELINNSISCMVYDPFKGQARNLSKMKWYPFKKQFVPDFSKKCKLPMEQEIISSI